MIHTSRLFFAVAFLAIAVEPRSAVAAEGDGDRALAAPYEYPALLAEKAPDAEAFASLKAEVVIGKLKISYKPAGRGGSARLWYSVDRPGRWAARHWLKLDMPLTGRDRVGKVPVDAPDVPIVYFVEAASDGATVLSPMRVCEPRKMGVKKSSRAFWSFLAGFEDGVDGWTLLSGESTQAKLQVSTTSFNGRQALSVSIPEGKVSVAIGTTVVRGWHVQWKDAEGIRFHLRTKTGKGRLRMTAMMNAFSDQQQTAELSQVLELGPDWKQVNVFFSEFRGLNAGNLDFIAFEFIGEEGAEFLLDDLRLLGDWASL